MSLRGAGRIAVLVIGSLLVATLAALALASAFVFVAQALVLMALQG